MEPVMEPVTKVTDTTRGRMAGAMMLRPMATAGMEAATVEALRIRLRRRSFQFLLAYRLRAVRVTRHVFRRVIPPAGRRVTRLRAGRRAGRHVCRRAFHRATRYRAMRRVIHHAGRLADHPAGRAAGRAFR